MKRTSLVLTFLLAALVPAAAQTQIRERRSTDRLPVTSGEQPASRDRVIGATRNANHAGKENPNTVATPNAAVKPDTPKPAWGDTAVQINSRPSSQVLPPPRLSNATPNSISRNSGPARLVKPTALAVNNGNAAVNLRPAPSTNTVVATSTYRVGVGDVLDIQLAGIATRESTLFTVMKDGALEYPLLSRSVNVTGLTTDEIARRLSGEIKVIQNARAIVRVRDYASHAVVITGLVDNPGRKVLRREAMPLFAILAEALPRSEATMATITRDGRETTVSLANSQELSTLVMSGDIVKISGAPKQFVYLGGDVASVGEKEFRDGMTLTQALLAAGGVPRDSRSKVKIARRNRTGFLTSEEHNLQAINDGKTPDPLLQPGDRIEVGRGVW
jgi:protein involved in polysaccharide export with SLBB domain